MERERCEHRREREVAERVRVAGTPDPERRAVCGGAGRELPGGERHSETFERRQTLPLSTLTPTISPKKAVNPLLLGQARGKVSADSQLPSLPRLIPFGQVNNSIATSLLLPPRGLGGSFPKALRVWCPSSPEGCPKLRSFARVWVCLCDQRGGTRRKRAALVKEGGDGSTRAPWGTRCPGGSGREWLIPSWSFGRWGAAGVPHSPQR